MTTTKPEKLPPTTDPQGRCGTYPGARAHRRRRESLCDPCREQERAYVRERQRLRRADPEKRAHDREKARPGDLARYHRNRTEDPDRVRGYERKSYASQMSRAGSPRRVRMESRANRGRSAGKVPGIPTTATLQDRLAYYGGRCWVCGVDTADAGLHWDHVKPISKGGADALCNLRPTCPSCNLAKGNTWPYTPL